MGIIAGLKTKGKTALSRLSPDWIIVGIILLSATGAFGLGYLAGRDAGEKSELKVLEQDLEARTLGEVRGVEDTAPEPEMAQGGQYVASKTGKSYHLPWCSGAKLIKEENKVWFATKEEAEARGYKPAGNCPGI